MTIYIDIDGTICFTPFENGQYKYHRAQPIYKNIEKFNKLHDEGHNIVYWTARGSSTGINYSDLTKEQLNKWGVKRLNLKLGKPSYDLWIDDKCINIKDFNKGVL